MEQYLINDTTLTAIGDSLRNKFGETKMEIVENTVPYVISKTSNALSFTERNGGYESNQNLYHVVTISDATKIKVKMAYQTESAFYDWVQVVSGNYPDATGFPTSATKYGGSTLTQIELEFDNTDTITFYFKSDGSNSDYLGYYAECTGYDVDGNVIDCILQEEVEVPNTYLPTEIPVAINNMIVLPEDVFYITGDCIYRFAYDRWNWLIEDDNFNYKFTSDKVTNLKSMFIDSNKLTKIPFDINMDTSANYYDISETFLRLNKLTILPNIINLKVRDINNLFHQCFNLREIPESFYNTWDWSFIKSTTNSSNGKKNNMFYQCYSLRQLPMGLLQNNNPKLTYSYSMYNNMCYQCFALDEIVNLPVPYTSDFTSSVFNYSFYHCRRLKNMTFETNEDGTPIVVKWKYQTIDLSQDVGYCNPVHGGDSEEWNENAGWLTLAINNSYITSYNSGITADKAIYNTKTYQALKDDPDAFCVNSSAVGPMYSRYNHDSAVATINSLPDASAYLAGASSGINTIKFKGEAGSKTDEGAISDLTAEEIAVAAAKGWTVTLV